MITKDLEAALTRLQSLDLLPKVDGGEPLRFSVHCFEQLPSTNQKAWELLNQGAGAGTVVIAQQQQAGRGQWGRRWESPLGGLYLSLALLPNRPVQEGNQLTLGAAWGIVTVLRSQNIPVNPKWPNDLIIQGKKLGGILTETRIHQDRLAKAVVGVGINWTNAVPATGINLKTALGKQPLPPLAAVAAMTLQGLALGYQTWQHQGVQAFLPEYISLLTQVGQPMTGQGQSGVIMGVSTMGELEIGDPHDPSTKTLWQPGSIRLGLDR